MQDYPPTPTEVAQEREQEALAESDAPPEMLRQQRDWDRRVERERARQ